MDEPSTRTSPAVDKAVAHVRQLISAGRVDQRGRLSGIHALAGSAGVSYASMWKALHVLADEGVIEGYTGGRFRVCGSEVRRAQPHRARQSRAAALEERVFGDILRGRFAPGSDLPSQKELAGLYGTSFGPLNRALRVLCSQGVLQEHKRLFRVATAGGPRPTARVVLLCVGEEGGRILSSSTRNEMFFGTIEREAALLNLGMDLFTYYMDGGRLVTCDKTADAVRPLPRGDEILGYMVLASPAREMTGAMLAEAQRFDRPVAVCDDSAATRDLLSGRSVQRRMQVFAVAQGEEHGARMGRYVLGLGHRRVAWLSAEGSEPWASDRLRGLRTVYEGAGLGEQVVELCCQLPGAEDALAQALQRGLTLADFVDEWSTRRRRYPASVPVVMEGQATGLVAETLIHDARLAAVGSSLAGVTHDSGITALVCANDHLALLALDHLRSSTRISVPRDLSVAAFDNTYASLTNSLTTYDFNLGTAIRSMLHFCISPERWKGIQVSTEHIPGMVIERGTTTHTRSQ